MCDAVGAKSVCTAVQVSQRFFNSHAIANMALSYRVASDGQLSDVRFAVGTFDKPALGAFVLPAEATLHEPRFRRFTQQWKCMEMKRNSSF